MDCTVERSWVLKGTICFLVSERKLANLEMEKPLETEPRPEGLVGEQEEIIRPQNIRPAIGARPTPFRPETGS